MRTGDFDFVLPADLIAQSTLLHRDDSRLLVMRRSDGRLSHKVFRDLPEYLGEGDVLVLNDSRVIPARLKALRPGSDRPVEIFLHKQNATNDWWSLLRPGKRIRVNTPLTLLDSGFRPSSVTATLISRNEEGHGRVIFAGRADILDHLGEFGSVPLPPYIHRDSRGPLDEDAARYQTVFARRPGSVAAPTAGLHFTEELIANLRARGVEVCFITLHVGLGTFAPVKSARIKDHVAHEEWFQLDAATADTLNRARRTNARIFAAGSTTLRAIEAAAARAEGGLGPAAGWTRLFIHPPHDFKVVNALITNFHLPKSTLLMLASAFASPGETRGRELLLAAYQEAIRHRYRFFSYGDAMLIL